jgi:3-deoxy-7-phosphoheptulonate synthase
LVANQDHAGALSPEELLRWRRLPAEQQPPWDDHPAVASVVETLRTLPPLISGAEIDAFARLLADVAAGRRLLLQAGDCAENPAHRGRGYVAPAVSLLASLAGAMSASSGRPVVTVGRIAGQYAKPRTKAAETIGGRWVPSFRGLMVNSPEPTPAARAPDPRRMLDCREAAGDTLRTLRAVNGELGVCVWTSHEALVLDYELPQLRRLADGRLMLTSTHWPWVGNRTRAIGAAHVALMAAIANPVACKVGPGAGEKELLAICEHLDPHRAPGRLTLICRQGAGIGVRRLPRLASAVRREGHPVIWLCDPMHGNTVVSASGLKTRALTALRREIGEFRAAIGEAGAVAGGLHLEATAEPVRECVSSDADIDELDGAAYTTLCDPRLNIPQAKAVLSAWTDTRHDQ